MPTERNRRALDWDTGVPIASGGSAEVVRAHCPALGRDIAIKYLKSDDPDAVERLIREAQAQSRLEHPHILKVHQTGVHLGRHYIAMDLVEGEPIHQVLETRGQSTRLTVFEQVVSAMALAHSQGIAHRDLKPANILIEQTDEGLHAWVMDFGLARQSGDATLTVTGQAMGTPGYMAPEQARGEKGIDARADVFALGVILYQIFTGQLPYRAESAMAMIMQAASGEITPIAQLRQQLPEGLARIVTQCLEFDPARRYAHAGELLEDIRTFRAGQDVRARRIGRVYRLKRWSARNRLLAGAYLAVVVTLIGFVSASIWNRHDSARQLDTSRTLIAKAERTRSGWYIEQMQPPHDQTGARRETLQILAELARQTLDLGPRATAEVNAAMADLHYELGHYRSAFDLAAGAWNAGLKRDEIADRAARSLLSLYNDERIERSLTVDPDLFDELELEARQQLTGSLDPFREHLHPQTRHLVDIGLQNSVVLPVELIGRIERDSPADWDTLVLLAQHLIAEAGIEITQDRPRALELLEAANSALLKLADTARSSVVTHLALCQLSAVEANTLNTEYDPEAGRQQAQHCRTGLELHPDHPELLATHAYWLWQTAKHRLRAREDYIELLDEAIDRADRALVLDQNNHTARLSLGTALQLKGRWALSNGHPEQDYLTRAVAALRRAHETFPNDANILNNLAITWNWMATSHLASGEGSAADTARHNAVHWMRAAANLRPDDQRLVHNSLNLEGNLIFDQQKRGVDPSAMVDRVAEALEELIAKHPDYTSPYNTLALAWWSLAEFQQRAGLDAGDALDKAEQALRGLLAVSPEHESGQINLAGVLRHRYRFATTGPDPALEAAAEEALDIYRTLEKPEAEKLEFGCLIAEILHARGNWRSTAQRRNLLDQSEAISRVADNIGWSQMDCLVMRAEIAVSMHRIGHRPENVEQIWLEIRNHMEQQADDLVLAFSAARLADVLGHSDIAEHWLGIAVDGNPQYAALWQRRHDTSTR